MKLNDDNETVAAMDILVPKIGELIGGSQRYLSHHSYPPLPLALSCPVLPCPHLPSYTMPCPVLSCPAMTWPVMSSPHLSCCAMPSPAMQCPALPSDACICLNIIHELPDCLFIDSLCLPALLCFLLFLLIHSHYLSIDVSREDKLEVLERRCVESGLKTSDIWWYADLRRYGSVPHAGTVESNSMTLHGRVIADDCTALPLSASYHTETITSSFPAATVSFIMHS